MESASTTERDVEADIDVNMDEAEMRSPESPEKELSNGNNLNNSGIIDGEINEEEDALVCRENDPAWDEERRHYKKIVCTFRKYE
jgi:hypothetical protein